MHQSRLTDLTPVASETWAVTVAGASGGGVLNVISVMDGGTTLRKLSLRLPGEPAGRSSAGMVELAQFAGLSAGANGEMRSRDVEGPSGAVGQGAESENLTLSITAPSALSSSIFSPR